jgi:hypothetical protein
MAPALMMASLHAWTGPVDSKDTADKNEDMKAVGSMHLAETTMEIILPNGQAGIVTVVMPEGVEDALVQDAINAQGEKLAQLFS